MTLQEEIIGLIDSLREGEYWDFKEQYHQNPAELIHDIICLSNNRSNRDAYLIFGVCDGKRLGEVCGVEEDKKRLNQQQIVTLLRAPKWAFDVYPQIELKTFKVRSHEIDVLVIMGSNDVPYYLTKDYSRNGKENDKLRTVRANCIYTRVCDSNTPIDQSAAPSHVEILWKYRFGLLSQPLEQIKTKIKSKADWDSYEDEDTGDLVYYNKYTPEYTMRLIEDDRRLQPEFYLYNQMNESTVYQMLHLKYHMTTLAKLQIVCLDSGRYSTPCPNWAFVHDIDLRSEVRYAYKYILIDSLEYLIQQFLFDPNNAEQRYAKQHFDDVVLYFDTEAMQASFHELLESSKYILEPYLLEEKKSPPVVATGKKELNNVYSERIMIGKAAKSFLHDNIIKFSAS